MTKIQDLLGDQILWGHTSEETAYEVSDYPYSWKLRTEIRYWIETTKHGDRFVSQTLNPKTGKWNRPKKSTYSEVGILYLEEGTGHVKWTGVSTWSDKEFLNRFIELTGDYLSKAQLGKLAGILGIQKAFEGVEFEIIETTGWTAEQRAEQSEKDAEANRIINRRAAVGTLHAKHELAREFGTFDPAVRA